MAVERLNETYFWEIEDLFLIRDTKNKFTGPGEGLLVLRRMECPGRSSSGVAVSHQEEKPFPLGGTVDEV